MMGEGGRCALHPAPYTKSLNPKSESRNLEPQALVTTGVGGRCTKCHKVWVEEEEDGEDMRENGLLVCEDCRTLPPGHAARRSRLHDDDVSSDDEDGDDDGKRAAGGGDEDEEDGDDDDEEEVYEAEDDETVAEIAIRLGCDAHEMLRLNKGRYTGLTLNSRLFAGTLLLYPQEEEGDEVLDDDAEGGGKARKPNHQVGRRRKGFATGDGNASRQSSGSGKRKRDDGAGAGAGSESDGEASGARPGSFSTAHGHRRWGNRWGSGVIDPRCHGRSSANRPMQCSYSKCAMPTHSGRGDGEHGWKIVTSQTRAGNQDWGRLVGRVFCNACFMQYATRGTLVRPGRSVSREQKDGKDRELRGGSESGDTSMVETPREARDSKFYSPGRSPLDREHHGGGGSASKEAARARQPVNS